MAWRPEPTGGPSGPRIDVRATVAGAVVAGLVVLAIWFGSRQLRNFDAALIGYACATVFLAFGVTYRYVVWVSSPPARRWFRRGWAAFLSFASFRRSPTQVPRAMVGNLGLQSFIRRRGLGRWLAHQTVFWGVVLATAVTFPLTFGWIHFESAPDTTRGYEAFVAGVKVGTFDALSWVGWVVFHLLDISAVLVIAGCVYFGWRRLRDSEVAAVQRLGHDLVPLLALIVISVTGLLLTFSNLVLEGRHYSFLAIIHMAVVVLTLVYIPFGKFFHVVQRPASVGVQVAKAASLATSGPASCARCGEEYETADFVDQLGDTMAELGLGFGPGGTAGDGEPAVAGALCPRCKRVARGQAYLATVKGGFR